LSSPIISILCPVLNEAAHIDNLVAKFLFNDGIEKELFFIDASSTDDTKQKITELQKTHKNLFVITNPQKYVSFGFNKAFLQTKGKYIAFLGAHADYPELYFKHALKYLDANECDAIGGPLEQKGKTDTGKAIAYCMSHRFGVGGTEFRTSNEKQYVQSVAFAIYKREVFENTGLLDEQLLRNQDDELHYRLNAHGYKILMVPEMKCSYYVRGSVIALFSQYFQYGLFKPLVLKKVKSGMRIRHLIPTLFVLYFLSLPLAYFCFWWFLPLALYVLLDLIFSFGNSLRFSQKIKSLLVFPALHIAYGTGFLAGMLKNPNK
jgi:glycosyltransferase involved in cell wall biosynthesis